MTRARDLSNLIGSGNYSQTTLTATAGQTSFTVSHTPNFVQVFMNGLLLDPTVDFTANGTAIVLTEAAAVGDELEVVTYETFSVGDAITQTEADTRYVLDTADVITVSGSNVGIGGAPPAWSVVGPAVQVGNAAVTSYTAGSTKFTYLYNNAYYNGTNDTYIGAGEAGMYQMVGGSHRWFSAPSGAAGGTATLTEHMRIDSSGNVGIGTSSPNSSLTVGSNSHGVSLDYVNALPSGAGMFTSSQAHTAQAYGDLNIKARSDYAGYGVGLYTASSANSPQLRLKVDASGRVTMPYQPVFDVAYSGSGYSTLGTVVFNVTYANVGGHYNTSNGRFTAPVSGNYLFYTSYIKNSLVSVSRRRFDKNGYEANNGRHLRLDDGQSFGDNGVLQAIMYLNANDYVTVNQFAGSSYGTPQYDYFGGYLIG